MQKSAVGIARSVYTILSNNSLENIIKWDEEGTSFSVLDTSEFEQIILKNYFPNISLKIFKKNLKSIGFRHRKTEAKISFSHKYFLREKPQLLEKMNFLSENPSRKKNYFNRDLLVKITQMESMHNRIEEAAEDLQRNLQKIIDLNKTFILQIQQKELENASSQSLFQEYLSLNK